MRWTGQQIATEDEAALPGMGSLVGIPGLVRSVTTPEFSGIRFHEVMAKSALNRVAGDPALPFDWTINPYRGCSHGCTFCFARNTHTYLDFDAGRDFDSEIVVKVNVADVLARELAKPSWRGEAVALGTNTDPYQRAEGRYRLMPGIIAALAHSGTPFSILTKGSLLRRDLELLADAAQRVPVDLAMTIAVLDDEVQQSVEPGAPTAASRLETVRRIREHGLDCTVFMMPILPFITDSGSGLDRSLAAIAESGATSVLYSALHLRPGAREWFLAWLARTHPDLVARYEQLYHGSAYAPQGYRRWLAARIQPLIRRHGLDSIGGRYRSRTPRRAGAPDRGVIEAELPLAAAQPTLF